MAIKLNRSKYSTNEAYLFHLYNDLGCLDLKVAYNYVRPDGGVGFSKWISFEYLMHLDQHEKVEGTFDTKKDFLNKVTHRSILDIEILLDIDEVPFGGSDKDDIKVFSENICKRLIKQGYQMEVYFSGSKSYHISLLFPEFRRYHRTTVESIRRKILERLGADKMKFHTKSMIALEGVPHWKTGVVKEEVKIE
jgi:hypothetical protein